MGMYLMRQIGSRGVYGNPILPDFMVFLNYKELPWFWHGFDQFWFAAIMIVLVPSLLALALGWFAFRSRVTGVYLSIITQAMTFALMLAFFRNDMGLGGNNGLTDFKDIWGFSVQADGTRAVLCFASALALAIFLVIAGAVVGSRFGKALTAVRDAESRMRFLGYRVEGYKLFVFVLSAAMAGVGGRALRAAGRHHQSQRVLARQLDRGGAVGRRRRPRHPDRPGDRRLHRQLRQDLADRRPAGGLAVRAGRAVHRRHAVPAQGRRRPVVADPNRGTARKARAPA